jgi:glutamate-ammonia-ligase adenylyltransferase
MIDELLDALQLDELPTRARLESNMRELAKGATDIVPILHGFKNTQHMRVGIRDILGRDEVRQTQQSLADVAEICLKAVTEFQYQRLLNRYAAPALTLTPSVSGCPLVILALGKLGGGEPNYHSDLDVIFLYDSEAIAQPLAGASCFSDLLQDGITAQFFFSELAAAITQIISDHSQYGRLYEIDSRLRPTGKSGALAVSTDEFHRYFSSAKGQLWERQALCKARPVFGSEINCERVKKMVHTIVADQVWLPGMATEIQSMRLAMQKGCSPRNLKRGSGGTVDVEFAIQMLQLKHAKTNPEVLVSGTLKAIEQLELLGFLSSELGNRLRAGYELLRTVEARLRLMNTAARHDLPENKKQMDKLAFLLQYQNAGQLEVVVEKQRREIRQAFEKIFSSMG